MALAWNAGWVNALRGSNPLSSAREAPVTCHGGFLLFEARWFTCPLCRPVRFVPIQLRINGRSSPSECKKATFIRWRATTRSE